MFLKLMALNGLYCADVQLSNYSLTALTSALYSRGISRGKICLRCFAAIGWASYLLKFCFNSSRKFTLEDQLKPE